MADSSTRAGPALPFRAAFPHVALIVGVFFFNFLSRFIPAPFLVQIEAEFSASHVQAGSIFFFLSLGTSAALLGSGFLARHIRHRGAVCVSSTGVGVMLLVCSAAPSLFWLKFGMLALGLCVGLYLPSGISTLTSLLAPKDWGKGLGMHEMAPNLAFISAPAIAAAVEGVLSWRAAIALVGCAALAMAAGFASIARGGRFPGETPMPKTVLRVLRTPHFWILTGLFTLAAAANFGAYNMLPLYLMSEHGLQPQWANNLVSMSRIPCLVMALSAGILLDRIGVRPSIVLALGFTGAMTLLLGLLQGQALQAAVLAQALFASCFFPAGFTAISWSFPDKVRNVAVSVIIPPATLLGIGVTPALLGWFGDAGLFPVGFAILGSIVVLGCGLVGLLSLKPALADEKE